MFLKKAVTIIAIAAQLCSSLELESIAKYEGQHSHKCMKQQRLTGTLLKDKIFTFGGCFPVPYMVDPENDIDAFSFDFDKRFNTTDTVYSYDILQDSWTLETHAPLPLNDAKLQVVNDDIYLYDVYAEPDRNRSLIWKYATDTKEWQTLGELPFVWRYRLLSCENDGIIYFAGNHDGSLRNIVQRYDTTQNEWKKPLFLDAKIEINKMFCTKEAIQFVGQKAYRDNEGWIVFDSDTIQKVDYTFYSSSYEDGKTVDNGFNVSLSYAARATPNGEWLYVLDPEKKNSTISKVNVITQEVVKLGTIDYTLKNTLFVPYKDGVAYLIGGGGDNHFGRRKPADTGKDELKTYNHKVRFIEEDVLRSDEQQIVIENH